MKLWRLIVLAAALPMLFSCGGGGVPGGGFSYGKKFQGSWMDKDTYRSSDFYIQLDEQGNIVSDAPNSQRSIGFSLTRDDDW